MTTPLLLYLWVIFKSELILQFTLALTGMKQSTSFRCRWCLANINARAFVKCIQHFSFFSTNTINILTGKWNTALADGTTKLNSWTEICAIRKKQENKIVQHKEENTDNCQYKQQLYSSPWVAYITIHCLTTVGAQSQTSDDAAVVELVPLLQNGLMDLLVLGRQWESHLEGCDWGHVAIEALS